MFVPLTSAAPAHGTAPGKWLALDKCLLNGMRHRDVKAVARVTQLVMGRQTAEPALGHLGVLPRLLLQ